MKIIYNSAIYWWGVFQNNTLKDTSILYMGMLNLKFFVVLLVILRLLNINNQNYKILPRLTTPVSGLTKGWTLRLVVISTPGAVVWRLVAAVELLTSCCCWELLLVSPSIGVLNSMLKAPRVSDIPKKKYTLGRFVVRSLEKHLNYIYIYFFYFKSIMI